MNKDSNQDVGQSYTQRLDKLVWERKVSLDPRRIGGVKSPFKM